MSFEYNFSNIVLSDNGDNSDKDNGNGNDNNNNDNDNNNAGENSNNKDENLKDFGSINTDGKHGDIYCISIVGQIEGHNILPPQTKTTKYEHIIPRLVEIEEEEHIRGLLVLLNTVGGDVEAGLAIAEMIASMSKPTVSIVLGGGHSIGVPLAVSAKCSFIVPSATMTLHPIRMSGTVIGVPQTFDYFSKVQDRIAGFVADHSAISKECFMNYIMQTGQIANDVGTILFGEEAVKCGLIDKIGGISQALDEIGKMLNSNDKK